jgi:hypothetical protein
MPLGSTAAGPQQTSAKAIRRRGLPAIGKRPHLQVMTTLDLTYEETAALTRLVADAIDRDRYPLSPRVQTLKGILGKIRPEPAREPLPQPNA